LRTSQAQQRALTGSLMRWAAVDRPVSAISRRRSASLIAKQ
jgi:hypothetical protein